MSVFLGKAAKKWRERRELRACLARLGSAPAASYPDGIRAVKTAGRRHNWGAQSCHWGLTELWKI